MGRFCTIIGLLLVSCWAGAGANKMAETFEINREVGRKQYFRAAFAHFRANGVSM
jgi:hypothetical protein